MDGPALTSELAERVDRAWTATVRARLRSAALPGSTSQRNQERVGLRLAYTETIWVDASLPAPA